MTKSRLPQPLSIKVISAIYLIGSVATFQGLPHATIVLGFPVSGIFAFLKHLAWAVLLLGLAIGLWRLHETARRVAILYECYNFTELWLLTWLVSLMTGSSSTSTVVKDFIAKDLPPAIGSSPDAERLVVILGAIFGFMMIPITLAIIWFLVKRKSAFVKFPSPSQPSKT